MYEITLSSLHINTLRLRQLNKENKEVQACVTVCVLLIKFTYSKSKVSISFSN